jgi:hypothetical protein
MPLISRCVYDLALRVTLCEVGAAPFLGPSDPVCVDNAGPASEREFSRCCARLEAEAGCQPPFTRLKVRARGKKATVGEAGPSEARTTFAGQTHVTRVKR